MEFILISTDHLCEQLWFKDDEDFKTGMNYVAIITFTTGIKILSFSLMSNHVHFVVQATQREAEAFINHFKQIYANYYQRKYGAKKFLRRNGVDFQRLDVTRESLERAIAYTQMNPVAANICLHPTGYRWGTGDCFFREKPVKGQRLGNLSFREQARILHSRIRLNQEWMLSDDGYILPESYIPIPFVERVFRTPSRMNYFLNNSSKAKARMNQQEAALPSFRDQTIMAAVPELCRSLFRNESQNQLDERCQAELIRQIRYRFSADIHQIARVLGKSYAEITRLLDSF